MNIIKLQDILKGVPDNRLQKELQNPTGEIPSYLVLSEVVRRDKLRQGMNAAPSQSSVLDDAIAKSRSAAPPQQGPEQDPQQGQEEQPQQAMAGYADGGFISPNNAMAQSGVRGFENMQKPPQQQIQLGRSAPSMFAPNMNPKPAPMVSAPVNVSSQGYQPDAYQPDGYENNSFTQSAMARGGIVALAGGDMARSNPSKAEIIAYIREAALRRGMDPDIALKVAGGEGLHADPTEGYQSTIVDDAGNREESYGIFQLNMNPGAVGDQMLKTTGIHPRDNPLKAIDFALDTANKVGWSPWMGAAAVDVTGKMGTAGGPAGDVVESSADSGMGAASEGHSPDAVKAMQEDESFLSTIGDMFGGDAVKMGKILMNKQEERRVPLLDLSTRGDPKAAASTRTRSPAEILEAYQNLRGSYMAHGGAVRMKDGSTPPRLPFPAVGRAPTKEQAEEIQLQDEILRLESDINGIGSLGLTPTEIEMAKRRLEEIKPPETPTAPEEAPAPQAAPVEMPAEPAVEKKGVYDLLREMQTSTTQAEQAYYDEMLRMEREKAEQSGGLGAFLRQMGLGMMASPGSLQQQLVGGLYSAGTSREETQAAMKDKINELTLAKKKADIEAIKNRIQLQVDELTAGQLGPKDQATLAVRALEAKLKDETDPDARKIIMEQIDSILRSVGVNIPTFLPTDEEGNQDATGIWDSIFGSSDR